VALCLVYEPVGLVLRACCRGPAPHSVCRRSYRLVAPVSRVISGGQMTVHPTIAQFVLSKGLKVSAGFNDHVVRIKIII
jgi:hypothetical protein